MTEVLSLGWSAVERDNRESRGYYIEAIPLEGLPGQVVRAMLFVCVYRYVIVLYKYVTRQS